MPDIFKIAIDLRGADNAPFSELEGVERYLQTKPEDKVRFILLGEQDIIEDALNEYNINKDLYEILPTSNQVTMDDEATAPLKTKKKSSIYKGVEFVKQARADAFLSAGNTGAMLSTATILLGRVKGVSRPTIGTFFPTSNNHPTLILDAGANIDSKPKFLYEFAVMGSLYFKEMFGVENPRVGLLNIGEEETKGTEVALATHKLLKESDLNFIGNVEGRDIFTGKSHVIVCDGFTGNIILKFAESFLGFFKTTVREYTKKSLYKKVKIGLIQPTLKEIFKDFDYQEYGGVPLLGVNGVVIIGHGSSSGKAVQNMIKRSIEIIKTNLNSKIEKALKG